MSVHSTKRYHRHTRKFVLLKIVHIKWIFVQKFFFRSKYEISKTLHSHVFTHTVCMLHNIHTFLPYNRAFFFFFLLSSFHFIFFFIFRLFVHSSFVYLEIINIFWIHSFLYKFRSCYHLSQVDWTPNKFYIYNAIFVYSISFQLHTLCELCIHRIISYRTHFYMWKVYDINSCSMRHPTSNTYNNNI